MSNQQNACGYDISCQKWREHDFLKSNHRWFSAETLRCHVCDNSDCSNTTSVVCPATHTMCKTITSRGWQRPPPMVYLRINQIMKCRGRFSFFLLSCQSRSANPTSCHHWRWARTVPCCCPASRFPTRKLNGLWTEGSPEKLTLSLAAWVTTATFRLWPVRSALLCYLPHEYTQADVSQSQLSPKWLQLTVFR